MIYLDTHVVTWLYIPSLSLLSTTARTLIDSNDLYVSPMVLLELQYLHELGRLSAPGNTILQDLHTSIGLRICDFPFPPVIHAATGLKWTRDPFDRIIVGHAVAKGELLLTRDKTIRDHFSGARW